jgi:hypothetical protein
MAMSQAQALESDQAQALGQRKPWFELWGTYAVAFLVAVSVAILLPNGPSRLGVSVTTYVLIYSGLGFVATLSGILGGLALFRSFGRPGPSRT